MWLNTLNRHRLHGKALPHGASWVAQVHLQDPGGPHVMRRLVEEIRNFFLVLAEKPFWQDEGQPRREGQEGSERTGRSG